MSHSQTSPIRRGLYKRIRTAAGDLVRLIYRKSDERLIEKDLTQSTQVPVANFLSIERLLPQHVPMLRDLRKDAPAGLRWIRDGLQNGYSGFTALEGRQLVGYLLYVRKGCPLWDNHPHLRRFDLKLAEEDVYIFDLFISPEHRGRGRGTEFLHKIQEKLRNDGYTRVLGYVDASNVPARTLYSILGWNETRTCIGRKFFKKFLWLDGRLFTRNSRRGRPYSVDYKLICSFRP